MATSKLLSTTSEMERGPQGQSMSVTAQVGEQSITSRLTRMNLLVSGIALLSSEHSAGPSGAGVDDFHKLCFRSRVQ